MLFATTKKIAILLLVIIVAIYVSLTFFSKRSEPTIFIMPNNYIGPLLIVHGQAAGVPVKYIGKQRVYDIPQSGILFTQFGPNCGQHRDGDWVFYYREMNGALTKLKYILDWNSEYKRDLDAKSMSETIVHSSGVGYTENKEKKAVLFAGYIVGPSKDGEEIARKELILLQTVIESASESVGSGNCD